MLLKCRLCGLSEVVQRHPKRHPALGESQLALRASGARSARYLVRLVGADQLARAGNASLCYLGLSGEYQRDGLESGAFEPPATFELQY